MRIRGDTTAVSSRIAIPGRRIMAKGGRLLPAALVILGLLLPGCSPETRREVVTPRVEQPPPPISTAEVESIMARLAGHEENKKMDARDRQMATDLLNSLNMVKSYLAPPVNQAEAYRITRVLFESLSRLEKDYFAKERFDEAAYPKVLESYASMRKKILKDYVSGNHEGVINQCIGLQDTFGKAGLTPEVGLLFSISLAARGRLGEAVKVGEKVLGELEGGPDSIHLRSRMVEWYLSLGQKKNAQDSLEKLARISAEREDFLRQSQGRLKEEDRDAASAGTTSSPETPSQPTEAPAFQPLEKLLAEVDGLIRRNELTKAKFLLLQQRIRFPEGPETEAIDQAMQRVEEAADGKPAEEGTAALPRTDETDGFRQAKRLVEEEKFEEAISKLEEMQRDGTAGPDARELREAAIEKLINRERNKAARLFLMARGTSDPAKKRELLSTSYNMLKNLVDKYPTSPLNSKINDNLNRIREEMDLHKGKSG